MPCGLVALRRSLTRLLGRPIGLSGSGPTVWTLYPSLDEAELAAELVADAIEAGTVPSVGDAPPTIVATTIRTHHRDEPVPADKEPAP